MEPECPSGLDRAAYPQRSPPAGGEHAEPIAPPLAVFPERVPGDTPRDIRYATGAGLDVHKDPVVAWVRGVAAHGKVQQETRPFGTRTSPLLERADGLAEHAVTPVARESTGVYGKPIGNLVEDQFPIVLVQAQHLQQVPGRQTAVQEAAWMAPWLQLGLRRGRFVPDTPLRHLRERTRQRRPVIQTKASVAHRIQKVLEDANLKLGSVATDVLGVSGRDRLRALLAGHEDPVVLAEWARGKVRVQIPQLRLALQGRVTAHPRFLLQLLWDELTYREGLISRLRARITEVLPSPVVEAVQRLATLPGMDARAAENLLADIGIARDQFPNAGPVASWTGRGPGNGASAGKRPSGPTTTGNRWLRATLVHVAWAASHTKPTYLSAPYRRRASRRGKQRALVALGPTILVILEHLLKDQTSERELGAD